MATIDKTKLHTYNFLSENKSIEDIKKQENIEVKEIKNKRHGGKTFKLVEKNDDNIEEDINDLLENNIENIELGNSNLTIEIKEQETNNDIWTKLKNFLITSTSKQIIKKMELVIFYIYYLKFCKEKEYKNIFKFSNKIKIINTDFFKIVKKLFLKI